VPECASVLCLAPQCSPPGSSTCTLIFLNSYAPLSSGKELKLKSEDVLGVSFIIPSLLDNSFLVGKSSQAYLEALTLHC